MLNSLCFFLLQDQYISVLIKNGHPVFRYKIDSELPKEIENNVTLNDGMYKQVSHFKQLIDCCLWKSEFS